MPSQSLSSAFRFPRWTQIPVNELIPSSQDEDQQVAPEIKSRRVYLMGTVCTLKYLSWKPEKAFGQMESMVRILEEAESELSTWKDESFISRLNRLPVGVPMETGPSSIALFLKLRYWSKETQQTFDPTVGKLLQAYEIKTGGRWPTARAIETVQLDTGMQYYKLDGNRHRITKTRDIHMDAGSFGKGEALDRIRRAHGTADAWMVDLGGQILVHGSPTGKSGWPVAIAHPCRREEAFLYILLKTGSLATSGGSERDRMVGNRRLGHILDPRTGKPAGFKGSVSVWHEQALIADILSTALYVMGPEKGLSWADGRNVAACFLVPDMEENVEILASQAFSRIAPGCSFTDY